MKTIGIKRMVAVTAAVALISGAAVIVGCGGEDKTEYTVTYDYNYEGAPAAATQKVEEGKTAQRPADPVRDGYSFGDWYTEAACTDKADFSAAITQDVTYYAGWTQNTVDVTFILYGTQTQVERVVPGETVEQPAEPVRAGYVFEGWYADGGFETAFDFSAPVTQAVTVYANWIQVDDGQVIITYMWNYEGAGIFKRDAVDSGSRLSNLPSAEREGYMLNGWYTDEGCSAEYVPGRVEANLTLYAGWNKGYVFEAEYTNLNDEYDAPRPFQGYSENMSGTDAIATDATGTASNGYYVGGMYIKGSYLYFEINSEVALENVYLTANFGVGTGFGSGITLNPDRFAVTVNGNAVSYADITLSYNPRGNLTYSDFVECAIGNISLDAGKNVIRLEVTNEIRGEGGTQDATAPLVDCITIYSHTEITWEPLLSNVR